MKVNLPSKPTLYHGVRFRSRIEARWAWFWDQIGVEWRYEPHRYVIAYTYRNRIPIGYRPDFLLPQARLFVEIKGPRPNDFEIEKAERLAIITSRPVTVIHGGMQPRQMSVATYAQRNETCAHRLPHPILPWPVHYHDELIRQLLMEASWEREEMKDSNAVPYQYRSRQ